MLSGVKGNHVGEYLKGATEAGATLAKEAVLIDDSNKVKERINILFILFCVKILMTYFRIPY